MANNQGIKASRRRDRNAISGGLVRGRQVRRNGVEEKRGEREGGKGGALEIGEGGVGRIFFPSTSPTCLRASRRAPFASRQTLTLR